MGRAVYALSFALLVGCSSANGGVAASEPYNPLSSGLKNCNGKASSTVPSDGAFVLTTFGGPGEGQTMSCGSSTQNGTWYYAASRQRYGCGAKIQISANGKCVVAQTDDYGPDVCVEDAAQMPIIDASPMVAQELFGVSGAGWSDHLQISVTQVDASTALGPCAGDPGGSGGSGSGCDPNVDPSCGSGSGGSASSGGGGAGGCDPYFDPSCGAGGTSGDGGAGGCDPYTDPNCGACDPNTDPSCGGAAASCGDGYCDSGEDCNSCPNDCYDPYC